MMIRIPQAKSIFLIKVNLRLCFLCSFFFVWGCGKPATSPVLIPGDISALEDGNSSKTTTMTASAPSIEVAGLPSDFHLSGRVAWIYSHSTTLDSIVPPPRLRVSLALNESEARKIVAYGNLRLSRSKTDSGRLKLAQGDPAERLASGLIPLDHFLLWKNRSRNITVIPVDFLHPQGDPKTLTDVKGTISLTSAGASSVEKILDLQSFISNDSPESKMPPDGVEIHLLQPEYEGDFSSVVVTFASNVIISDTLVLDDKGNRLKETWAELSRLSDGRTRIVLISKSNPLTEKWQLQFERHSGLLQSEIDFDFRNMPIPKLDQKITEEQKRLVRWTPTSLKTVVPKDHHVDAKVSWSNIISFDKNGNENTRPLEIYVDIIGPKSEKTVGFGHLKIGSAVVAGEQLILIQEENATYSGSLDGIIAYDPFEIFPRAPVDGARVIFPFQPTKNEAQSIDEFTGSCTLLTTTAQKTFVIDDIMQFLDKAIEHPLLKKHNIMLVPEMFGSGLSIPVKADNVLMVQEMAAIDKSGGTSPTVYCGRQQFNERMFFSIIPQDELPEVIPVRITINEGLEEMTVPFDFKELPIPSPLKDVNVPHPQIKSSSR